MTDYLRIDENLRTAMRFFGEATDAGDVTSLPGSLVIYCGLNYGVFNIALLDGPVDRTTSRNDTLESRLQAIAEYFKQKTDRWSFWLCEDLLDDAELRRAERAFQRLGLRAISYPPGMITDKLLPPVKPLPEIELRPVLDDATRQAFGDLTASCFDIPPGIAQRVYVPERAWRGAYQGYVAYVQGQPVSMVASVLTGKDLGIYSLGTHPAFRRRRYGEAAMRGAIAEVARKYEIHRYLLQSTEVGHPLYRRMGFRDAARFTVYLTT
jgi:ribosomal protein S18 acetylase RimI-like enzyme